MSDDVAKPVRQEVLPPVERDVVSHPHVEALPQGFMGSSLFARARYASEAKQVAAYRELVSAKNALLRVLSEGQGLVIEYGIQSERAQSLDELRAVARARVGAEMNAVLREEERNRLVHENEIERLLFERDRWKKAREELNAPKRAPAAPPTVAEQIAALGQEIDSINKAVGKWRADEIEKAGGEANLPESTRRRIEQLEFIRDQRVYKAMEGLF